MPVSPVLCMGLDGIFLEGLGGQIPPNNTYKVFEKPRPLGGECHFNLPTLILQFYEKPKTPWELARKNV